MKTELDKRDLARIKYQVLAPLNVPDEAEWTEHEEDGVQVLQAEWEHCGHPQVTEIRLAGRKRTGRWVYGSDVEPLVVTTDEVPDTIESLAQHYAS